MDIIHVYVDLDVDVNARLPHLLMDGVNALLVLHVDVRLHHADALPPQDCVDVLE